MPKQHDPTETGPDAPTSAIIAALRVAALRPSAWQLPQLLALAARRLEEQEKELHATRDAAAEWERAQYELARGLRGPDRIARSSARHP